MYRGGRHVQQQLRPDVALSKAREFIEVENDEEALATLQECLKSRKHRQWTNHHPIIMELYIDMCIKLRKSQVAKEGLYQCKNMTQHNYPEALYSIIEYYLKKAHERVHQAKKDSEDQVSDLQSLKDVDDLENSVTPEALLLQAVTANTDSERADRSLFTPWVKFLWDAYRMCLDIVKNNKGLEKLYRTVGEKACDFCKKFERKNEFRKLCDTKRQHLKQICENNPTIVKQNNRQLTVILLNGKDEQHYTSQEIQTEIRVKQLETAIKLELWQEAFKAIEDIHTLQQHTRRIPKSYPNLARFKSKFMNHLSRVLMKAGQPLFHAATCHNIFFLNRDMKANADPNKLKQMASQTIVATLSIPLTTKQHGLSKMLDLGQVQEKHQRLAKILNYERLPVREQLVDDLKFKQVIKHAPRELADLFKCLEIEFNPLRLAERVEECLNWLKDEDRNPYHDLLSPYVSDIQHVTASRVLQQVAQTYDTIVFDRLKKLVPFYNIYEVEQHILDACRTGQLRAKIDHSDKTVTFGSIFDPAPLCVQTRDESILAQPGQDNDWLNQQLNSIHVALSKASAVLRTEEQKENRENEFMAAAKLFRKTDGDNVEKFNARKTMLEKYIQKREQDISSANKIKKQKLADE
jgi:translation initiation factor 3 subunit A